MVFLESFSLLFSYFSSSHCTLRADEWEPRCIYYSLSLSLFYQEQVKVTLVIDDDLTCVHLAVEDNYAFAASISIEILLQIKIMLIHC